MATEHDMHIYRALPAQPDGFIPHIRRSYTHLPTGTLVELTAHNFGPYYFSVGAIASHCMRAPTQVNISDLVSA